MQCNVRQGSVNVLVRCALSFTAQVCYRLARPVISLSCYLSTKIDLCVCFLSELHAAESVACLNKALNRLKDIWEEIGIPEDQRLQRTDAVKMHIKVITKTEHICLGISIIIRKVTLQFPRTSCQINFIEKSLEIIIQ